MVPARRAGWVLFALVALRSTAGFADEVRVLVVRGRKHDDLAARIRDELVTLGVHVDEVDAATGELSTVARTHRASAVLRVSAATVPRAVEIWVDPTRDLGSSKDPPARIEEDVYEEGDVASALALRAVELVRGRLIKIDLPTPEIARQAPSVSSPAPTPPPESTPPIDSQPASTAPSTSPSSSASIANPPHREVQPDRVRKPLPQRAPRVALAVGPAILASPGGLPAGGGVHANMRWHLFDRIAADVIALVPVVPARFTSSAGVARVNAGAIGLGGYFDFLDPGRPVTTGAGIGIGAGLIGFSGEPAQSNRRAASGVTGFAMPYARWGLAWRALPPLGVEASLLIGIARPRPVVELDAETRAAFGEPFVAAGLSLSLSIP
jgi:hypothetical protein